MVLPNVMQKIDSHKLIHWFQSAKRDLPWRRNPTPYQIWISEVMLQQTQVAVVVPYYERWLKRFPTVHDLAEAPINEVLKLWEGLGYYSRARHLHAGAQTIVERFNGEIPSTPDQLKLIKGLGPYTIGAILSLAFQKQAAAVDGNVMRVLARFFAYREDISKSSSIKILRQIAEENVPRNDPGAFNEALIELGATICTRTPQCQKCPLRSNCAALAQALEHELPIKGKSVSYQQLFRSVAVVISQNRLLVKKGEKGSIMTDLYEFPYFEVEASGITTTALAGLLKKNFNLATREAAPLPEFEHAFTRFRVKLLPVLYHSTRIKPVAGYEWLGREEVAQLPFSSGHRRILHHLQKEQLW